MQTGGSRQPACSLTSAQSNWLPPSLPSEPPTNSAAGHKVREQPSSCGVPTAERLTTAKDGSRHTTQNSRCESSHRARQSDPSKASGSLTRPRSLSPHGSATHASAHPGPPKPPPYPRPAHRRRVPVSPSPPPPQPKQSSP